MTYIDFSELLARLSKVISVAQDIVKDVTARKLLILMGKKDALMPSLTDLRGIIKYGYINKVLLTFMYYGPEKLKSTSLYEKLTKQRENFLKHLENIIKVLDECKVNYVVFKTLRPVIDTPVDIDIIVEDLDGLYKAAAYLKKVFNVKIWSINYYSISIEIKQLCEYVDIYLKPHAANFVYLDNTELLRRKVWLYINEHGIELYVPVPRPELELCSVLLHAFIKEGLITLNDVLSILVYEVISDNNLLIKYLSRGPMRIIYNEFMNIVRYSHRLPAKVNVAKRFVGVLSLSSRDCTRESIPRFATSIFGRVRLAIGDIKRVTYIRGLER